MEKTKIKKRDTESKTLLAYEIKAMHNPYEVVMELPGNKFQAMADIYKNGRLMVSTGKSISRERVEEMQRDIGKLKDKNPYSIQFKTDLA